jgi:histidinol dehydrogenase
MMRVLDADNATFDAALIALTHYAGALDPQIDATVALILQEIQTRGDEAVLEYTAKFDHLTATSVSALKVDRSELAAAWRDIPSAQQSALEVAAERIRIFHERQKQESWTYTEADGTRLGQIVTPLDRVGIYVPGGKAAYPSSLLMGAIPAKVAGVSELVMVVPTPHGVRNAVVFAAAHLAGVDTVFTVGGAQAVGALAYGTATIPRVDKIIGPGNAYVAAAKRRVFGQVGIDMVAGPSEIVVIADDTANADWVAMDLFSQAEHDEVAQSILITPSPAFAAKVQASVAKLISDMPRAEIIRASLTNRGAIIVTRDLQHACEVSDAIAPEHLELMFDDAEAYVARLKHAGAIFVGHYACESLGDYCIGPNHVLPTSGTARFASPLGVYDFQKRTSLIHPSVSAAQSLSRVAATLAHGEGLTAHARAAEMRFGSK